MLNNIAHWNYEGFSLDAKKPDELSLRGAPYQVFILPIGTERPFNVLSPLRIKFLDLRNSRVNDLERLLGLSLDTIDVRWTKVRHEKVRLLEERIGLKKLIVHEAQFGELELKQMRKKIEVVETVRPE